MNQSGQKTQKLQRQTFKWSEAKGKLSFISPNNTTPLSSLHILKSGWSALVKVAKHWFVTQAVGKYNLIICITWACFFQIQFFMPQHTQHLGQGTCTADSPHTSAIKIPRVVLRHVCWTEAKILPFGFIWHISLQ